jgi:hypothetical protein
MFKNTYTSPATGIIIYEISLTAIFSARINTEKVAAYKNVGVTCIIENKN